MILTNCKGVNMAKVHFNNFTQNRFRLQHIQHKNFTSTCTCTPSTLYLLSPSLSLFSHFEPMPAVSHSFKLFPHHQHMFLMLCFSHYTLSKLSRRSPNPVGYQKCSSKLCLWCCHWLASITTFQFIWSNLPYKLILWSISYQH